MRPPTMAVWFAVAGLLLAVSFVALGDVSSEPSDHPRWLMAGSRPVVVAYVILMGFCLPGYFAHFVLVAMIPESLGYHALGGRPGDGLNYLTYPVVQGVLYGGVAWLMIAVGRAVRHATWPETMTLGASSRARPGQRSRWRPVGIVAILLASYSALWVYFVLPTIPLSWTADYDHERYTQISRAIKSDEHRLVGKSLDEVIGLLGLEHVLWDNGFTQMPNGETRIYHFRGFALYLSPQLLPPGSTPNRIERWTGSGEEVRRRGVLWITHSYPCVRVDGITDPKERMKQHWKEIEEGFERSRAWMRRERRTS